MLLGIAFIVLAVLLVLFGACAFMLVRTGEDDYEAEENYEDDVPAEKKVKPVKEKPERKKISEKKQKEAKINPEETKTEDKPELSETRKVVLPSERTDGEEKFKTRVATKAETEQIKAALQEEKAEQPAPKHEEILEETDFIDEEFEAEEKSFNLVPVIAIGAAAFIILGIVAFVLIMSDAKKQNDFAVEEPETITATIQNVRQETRFDGEIVCAEPDVRYFMATGKIKEVKVKEGDRVKAGQALYVLESDSVEERIELLKERLETATVTESTQVEERNNLTSSVSGTVADIRVSVGDTVSKGETIAVVSSPSDYRVSLEFEGDKSGEIENGDSAVVTSGNNTYEGTVSSVKESSVENLDGGILYTYNVTIAFKGSSAGSAARATVNGKSSVGSGAVSEGNRTNTSVRAAHDGKVTSVSLRVGASVKAGDTVAVVSSAKTVDETKTDELKAKDIQIQIEQLEKELENYTVKADKDGVVKKLYMKEGENAAINSQAAIIIPDGELYLRVDIDEDKAEKIIVPTSASYKIVKTLASAIPEEAWEKISTDAKYSGFMDALEPGEKDGIYEGHIAIEDQNGLYDGMKAEVMVTTYSAYDALLVPEEYVNDGKIYVWRANRAEEVAVETGIVTDDGYVEIKKGINSMDKIITENVQNMEE